MKNKAKKYYERKRCEGKTDDITANPDPDYSQDFYQAIFRLMEDYAKDNLTRPEQALSDEEIRTEALCFIGEYDEYAEIIPDGNIDKATELVVKFFNHLQDIGKLSHPTHREKEWIRFEDEKPKANKGILIVWPSGNYNPEYKKLTEEDLDKNWDNMRWIPVPPFKQALKDLEPLIEKG